MRVALVRDHVAAMAGPAVIEASVSDEADSACAVVTEPNRQNAATTTATVIPVAATRPSMDARRAR